MLSPFAFDFLRAASRGSGLCTGGSGWRTPPRPARRGPRISRKPAGINPSDFSSAPSAAALRRLRFETPCGAAFHTILPSESFGWRVYRQSLLPLRGNSPCVAGENRFPFFRACGRELCAAFSRRMSNRGLRPQPAMNRVFRNREKMPGKVSRATARSATASRASRLNSSTTSS